MDPPGPSWSSKRFQPAAKQIKFWYAVLHVSTAPLFPFHFHIVFRARPAPFRFFVFLFLRFSAQARPFCRCGDLVYCMCYIMTGRFDSLSDVEKRETSFWANHSMQRTSCRHDRSGAGRFCLYIRHIPAMAIGTPVNPVSESSQAPQYRVPVFMSWRSLFRRQSRMREIART